MNFSIIRATGFGWLAFLLISNVAVSAPFFTDEEGSPLSNTICGEDKMVKMYSEPDSFQKMGILIGIYKLNEDGGAAWCTGTLISKDLFITARHCFGECADVTVTFGFLGKRKIRKLFAARRSSKKGAKRTVTIT